MLEWIKIIVSWPTVGLLVVTLFYKPLRALLKQFTSGNVTTLRIGDMEIHRDIAKLAEQGQELKIEVREHEQKIEQQQEIINQLVMFSMSASIYLHLWQIHNSKEYLYRNQEYFRRQMYYLSDNGYIQPKSSAFLIFDDNLDGKNLIDVAKLTPVGEFLVSLRGVPPEINASG